MADIDERRKPRFVIRLTDRAYGALNELAEQTGRSMSEVCTEAVEVAVGVAPADAWRGARAT